MEIKTTKQIIEESEQANQELQTLGLNHSEVKSCMLGKWVSLKDLKQRIKNILDRGDYEISLDYLEKLYKEL